MEKLNCVKATFIEPIRNQYKLFRQVLYSICITKINCFFFISLSFSHSVFGGENHQPESSLHLPARSDLQNARPANTGLRVRGGRKREGFRVKMAPGRSTGLPVDTVEKSFPFRKYIRH